MDKLDKIIASFEKALAFYIEGHATTDYSIVSPETRENEDTDTVLELVVHRSKGMISEYDIDESMLINCRLSDSGVGYIFDYYGKEIELIPLYTQDHHRFD